MGYLIEGVEVWFSRRDITQATDAEIDRITAIVKAEVAQTETEPGRKIEYIEFESDFVDATCKYVVRTRVGGYGDPADEDTSAGNR